MKRADRRRPWRWPLRAWALAACCAPLLACVATPAEHFYRLDNSQGVDAPAGEPPGAAGRPDDIRLVVGDIPDSIDRPQITLQRGPNEMHVFESERWAEPVRSGITQCLASGLARELPQAWIVTDGRAADDKAPTLRVTIDAMEADGAEARLQARWRLIAADGAVRVSERAFLRRKITAAAPADAVAAWSAELGELAQAMARSVRATPSRP